MAATIKEVNAAFLDAMASDAVLETFEEWKKQKAHNAMFKSIMNYLHRVETILFFIASSRNADLSLHLQAADSLSKLFFAFDRIKYKRLWPRYIADMHDLKTTHPETWKELEAGNLSVTRKSIPFVSIGANHACEHVNKQMKVHSGLIGISNNANARQRFFLATSVLSCMSREYKNQFLTSSAISNGGDHHELGSSKIKRDHAAIDKIKSAILSHGNPITSEGGKLYNIITHAYVPQEHVQKILNIDDTGQALYENYVEERINGETSLWTPVKKEKFAMFKSGNQKASVKTRNKSVDLKETKDLYGRLLVISRSERQVDQKEAVANYEFTLTPRALFAPNGEILPCCDKSKMINLLQKLPEKTNTQGNQPKSADDELEHPAIQDRAETRSEFLVDVADLENLDTGNDLPPNTVNDDQYDSQDDLQTTNASHQNESQDDNNSLQASMENESPMDTEPTKSINQDDSPSRKIALVDGMVVVQKLTKKPSSVVTIKDLGRWFYDRLISMTRDYDEIILVFSHIRRTR